MARRSAEQETAIKTIERPKGSGERFASFDLCPNLLRAVTEAGFKEPRPIQAATIPAALEGRDILGLAQTGTGKTAAFALPIIERLLARRGERRGPRALILAPTRELALQIQKEIELLAKFTNVRSVAIFGGIGLGGQRRALQRHPEVIVACPGRLLDLAGSADVRLDGIETLVLDEGDHMLDMGFLPDIRRILAMLPERRQNMLFSATMPREIRGLAGELLDNPKTVELANSVPAETIEHALYPVDPKRKTELLMHLLGQEDFTSAIVFLRTKHRTRRLAEELKKSGQRAIGLQGNMSQGQRERAMNGFRSGRYNVLVATDIAARGIDVAGVSHVINFDVPGTPDAYTHRIGRTGRAERSGKACTLVISEDFSMVKEIERRLDMSIPRVKLEEFGGSAFEAAEQRSGKRHGGKAKKGGGGKWNKSGGGQWSKAGGNAGHDSGNRSWSKPERSSNSGGHWKKPGGDKWSKPGGKWDKPGGGPGRDSGSRSWSKPGHSSNSGGHWKKTGDDKWDKPGGSGGRGAGQGGWSKPRGASAGGRRARPGGAAPSKRWTKPGRKTGFGHWAKPAGSSSERS